jgi:hypothetical protein
LCVRLYLQEFALGRALKQQNSRRRSRADELSQSSAASVASSACSGAPSTAAPPGDSPEDLSQFLQAFKEMASNLDEDGARNLLVWSPLFLPTVEGLMRQGGEQGSRAPRGRLKKQNPPEVRKPAPHPRAQAVAAERLEHMNKLKAMYMAEQTGAGAEQAAPQGATLPVEPPAPYGATMLARPGSTEHVVPRAAQLREAQPRQRSPSAPPRTGLPLAPTATGDVLDDWEDEVDDLLNWTSTLPGFE